ncbi:MAG: limonene-1,2-epoxide hydrolase family protein [Novosphingobium sp.]
MKDEDAAAVVGHLIEAFNRRDADAIASLLHEDIVCAGMPIGTAHGRTATMALLAPFLAAEAIDWQVHAMAATGRIVLNERTDRFRFPGQDWTQVRAMGIFEIATDSRIIGWRDYFDAAEFAAAMPTI